MSNQNQYNTSDVIYKLNIILPKSLQAQPVAEDLKEQLG